MSYQVLARKWRPRSVYAEMVGQTSRIAGADQCPGYVGGCIMPILFTGTRGVGKTSLARVFAKALNLRERAISSDPMWGMLRPVPRFDEGRFHRSDRS